MSTDNARAIVRRSTSFTLSPSLIRLEAELRDPDVSTAAQARLIERSPALMALVLRMANSAYYSPREPVVALPRAIVTLGSAVLRQLVLHALVTSRKAKPRRPDDALAVARVLGDSVRAAVVARGLARTSARVLPDVAFAAGLLHDIGHVLLVDEVPGAYAGYLASRRPGEPIHVERTLTGTTHEEVGAAFADAWNLPSSLAIVLAAHHDPSAVPLASIIRATDRLVLGLSRPGQAWQDEDDPALTALLGDVGIDANTWLAGVPRLRDELAEMLTVLAVAA